MGIQVLTYVNLKSTPNSMAKSIGIVFMLELISGQVMPIVVWICYTVVRDIFTGKIFRLLNFRVV